MPQFWQCKNLGSAWHWHPSLSKAYLTFKLCESGLNTWTAFLHWAPALGHLSPFVGAKYAAWKLFAFRLFLLFLIDCPPLGNQGMHIEVDRRAGTMNKPATTKWIYVHFFKTHHTPLQISLSYSISTATNIIILDPKEPDNRENLKILQPCVVVLLPPLFTFRYVSFSGRVLFFKV